MMENSADTPSLRDYLPKTPFWRLVAHFVKRMFSSDEDSGTESMSLGIGAVLAILATPGTLASFFLLEKYADPRILLRGHRFDAYTLSAPDEYFFIVLSMIITALIMVLRWNRLLPDRRDFANLAVLPISSREVFLANFTALVILAFLFAVVVNGTSWFLFPSVVTFADGSLTGFFRVAFSHAITVFSASMFSFFSVFALVGSLMLIVPGRLFRSASVLVRLLLTIALLTAPFTDLFVQLVTAKLHPTHDASLRMLPSFWFLGLYESMAGFAKPAMAQLGREALLALFLVSIVSILAYWLCYGRHYLRLPESFDLLGSARHRLHIPLPPFLERLLFRSTFEHACFSFICKALVRSERHLMFFGAYLGVGFILTAETLRGSIELPRRLLPNADLLAAPLIVTFFLVTGLRFAFDIPAVLTGNWIFRSTMEKPEPPLSSIARKLALTLCLPWQLLLLTPVMAHLYGWPIAIEHTLAVVAFTLVLTDLLFAKFCAIPFTCTVQPDLRQILSRILASVAAVILAVPVLAAIERWMLSQPVRLLSGAGILFAAWLLLRQGSKELSEVTPAITFEQRPPSDFELLKLT